VGSWLDGFGVKSWGRRVSLSTLTLALILVCGHPLSAQLQTFNYWVNADNGSDAWPGTRTQPFKTINNGLQVTWHLLHPSPTVALGNPVRIHVLKTTVPYAPVSVSNPGFEGPGWLTDDEFNSGCTRAPFPIRMIDNVDLVGVADASQQRPVITIFAAGPFTNWTAAGGTCNTPLVHATVLAASSCNLENFLVDGLNVFDSRPPNDWPGVQITRPTTDFMIINCDVFAWHDELNFDAAGGIISASVSGGSFRDA
jgi:hypothetical protein